MFDGVFDVVDPDDEPLVGVVVVVVTSEFDGCVVVVVETGSVVVVVVGSEVVVVVVVGAVVVVVVVGSVVVVVVVGSVVVVVVVVVVVSGVVRGFPAWQCDTVSLELSVPVTAVADNSVAPSGAKTTKCTEPPPSWVPVADVGPDENIAFSVNGASPADVRMNSHP